MLELPPLGLYVHIPWCVRKCPYCDFNSHERPGGEIPEAEYVERLEADLKRELARAEGLGASNGAAHGPSLTRIIQSVFFGGGTPSLFRPVSFERLLEILYAGGRLAPGAEVTLEANPGTADAARFAGYRKAGINRLSLGVQSFNDISLSRLGRIHDSAEARSAIAMARSAGFDNINLDLMFGLPGQSREQTLQDLETAIDFRPEHISWYQLTLEPNTVFWRRPPRLPEASAVDEMQKAGLDRLARAGYERYEVSAFALEGRESRHNINYWAFGDYLGIGAGAHGKLTEPASNRIFRTRKTRQPKHFLPPGDHTAVEEVQENERPLEFLMNALRLGAGFSTGEFESRTGIAFGAIKEKIECLTTRELLELNGQIVRPTCRGYRLLDSILGEFA